jgi:hypothetical protein
VGGLRLSAGTKSVGLAGELRAPTLKLTRKRSGAARDFVKL